MAINELIDRIVNKEWNMPDQVRNMDGRASCKNDPETFRIMRSTQFMTWPENLLQRYPGGLGANSLYKPFAVPVKSARARIPLPTVLLLPLPSIEVEPKSP